MTVLTRPAPKPQPRPKRARKPMPRVNPARAAKRYEEAFGAKGEWLRKLYCCCTRKRTGDWVQDAELGRVQVVVVAAHFPSRGAGGLAKNLVPLSDHLHTRGHRIGEQRLAKQCGVNFRQLAAAYERHWQSSQRPIERGTK